MDASSTVLAENGSHRFSFKRKISFKNAVSLKLILDKAEYLKRDEEDEKIVA